MRSSSVPRMWRRMIATVELIGALMIVIYPSAATAGRPSGLRSPQSTTTPSFGPGQRLVGSEATACGGNCFGGSLAVSGDGSTALIAGFIGDDQGLPVGAVWVFVKSGSSWVQQGGPLSTGGGAPYALALSTNGDVAVISAVTENGDGKAWVYERKGSNWVRTAALQPKGLVASTRGFGVGVALSSDGAIALVSSGGYWGGALRNGALWTFERVGSAWKQQGDAVAPPGAQRDSLRVAMSGNGRTALLGGSGRAWLLTRQGVSWHESRQLRGVGTTKYFGFQVALSSDGRTAFVADGDHTAWIFGRRGGAWYQQIKISRPRAVQFGMGVALSEDGSVAVIGEDDGGGPGSAWVFTRRGMVWVRSGVKLSAKRQSLFGNTVALSGSGETVLVGAPEDGAAGAAYVFTRN